MSTILRDKFFGNTVEEWIDKVPGELSVDAVGLWQIVSVGCEGFGLSGSLLVDFVRQSILTLFEESETGRRCNGQRSHLDPSRLCAVQREYGRCDNFRMDQFRRRP